MISLKVDNLTHQSSFFLLLTCCKDNYKTLLEDWNQILGIYPILCDLWSDIRDTTRFPKLSKSLEDLDNRNEMPNGMPVPKGFVILFTQKYFETTNPHDRRAIMLHELGHFFVYQTGMLRNLRLQWSAANDMFEVFVKIIKQDQVWFNKNKKWVRKLYDYYVFDILKIPGEIFANVWVKDNFSGFFHIVARNQLQQLEQLVIEIEEKIRTRVVQFPLYSASLRVEGLLILMDKQSTSLKERTQRLLDMCRKKLHKYLTPKEQDFFKTTRQEIFEVCSSPQFADKSLYSIFGKFVNSNVLVPTDFS